MVWTCSARAHLKLLQLSLVCGNGHHQPVPLFLKLWPLKPHHFSQQLILKTLETPSDNAAASSCLCLKSDGAATSNCSCLRMGAVITVSYKKQLAATLDTSTSCLTGQFLTVQGSFHHKPICVRMKLPTCIVTVKLINVTLMQVSGK